MEEQLTIQEDFQEAPPQEDPREKLWKGLNADGKYTKSFEEFKKKYSTKESIDVLYSGLSTDGDYTKSKDEFYGQYFSDLKKKPSSTPSIVSSIGAKIGGEAGTSNGSSPQSEKQRLTDFIQGTKTKPTKEDYATAIAKGKPVLLKQGQQIGSDFGQQINKEAEKEQLISKASGIPSIPSIENNIIKQGGDKTSSWYENTQQKYSNKLKEIEDVTKYQFDNIIAEAERQSGDNITVPKDKTSLPNQSFLGVVGGNVTVDRKEFIKEWQTKKQEWLKNENVEVEKLKTRADQALDATTESMKPILEYAANNLSVYSKKNNDGVIVADPNEIDKLAQRTAAKYGVAGDGLYKKLIYNKITENINHAIIKPEVDKVFESKVKDAFGGKSLDDVMGDEYKAQVENLSEVTKITNSTKNDISVVSEKIKQDAQGEVGRINELAKAEIEEIKKQYNEVANTATTQEELDNTNAIFNKRIEEVGLKFLSDQNEINSRFNKIYTESINGITRVATKRLEDIAKSFKYKPSDELQAKIKNLYNDSYTSVIDKRGEAAEIRDAKKTWIGEGIAKMTTQLGGAIKNQATSLGWDAGEIIGDVLSSSYTPSSSELDSWKDIFNPRKLVTSGMSLAGGMLPTIAGTAAVTATTGGAGTPAALRMALAAITSFTFDTAQQMGSVWNEKFSETGNLSDANKAAKTMLDGQKAIMWTYAGSGLPFMGSSVKLAKNRAARVLLGIGIEHTSETGQEWFQDVVETAAIEGKSLKDAMGNLTWDRLKNNSLQIAPLSIFMGGGGQVGGILSEASKNRAMKANGEAFALKSEFNKLAPSQMNQFLFDMIQRQGMPFSKGYVASLFTSGHIDKTQLVEMQNLLSNSETLIKNANTYGLTPAQQKVYFWLDANKNKAIEDVAAQTDPIFIKAAEAKVKAIEQDMVNLASGEKVDYTVLTYPNNEQYVLSNQEAEQALKGNQFLSAYKNGDIKIETFGKRGGVQEQLDEIDSKKEPVKGHMAFEGSELNELETKAIEGLQGKDFAGSPIKPYTDVIQNPEASIEDKKEALKGLSDQLTAKGTEVVVGTTLGKEADLIYDLGYEVAQESEALQKLQSAETKIEEPTVSSAVIEIGGKLYEGKNHAEAILKAKADGQDISRVNRQAQGKFKLSDGTIIDRAEAKKRFGQDRSELMIEQDAAADQANKDYRKITDPNLPTVSETEGAGSSGVEGKSDVVVDKASNVGGDVDAQYNERKKSIEDKLNQQLEDNKGRLDDIEDKGGTKTVRQKIYQEHTNDMVELEKWKMKEDLKKEDTPDGKIKKNSEFSVNHLTDAIPNSEVHYENKEDYGVTTITLRDKNTKKHIASIDIGTGDTIDGYAGVRIQVNGEHQGKGLSKHLYNLALTEAKKQGLKGLYTIDEMLKTPDKTISTRDNFVTRKNTDEKLKTQARKKYTNVADPNITFIENVSDKFIKKGATKLSEPSLSKQESGGKAPVTKPEGKSDVVGNQQKVETKRVEKVAELEAERDMAILREGKPEVKMEFVTAKELVDSKDPIGNKKIHTDIKDRYKKMRELLDCLWT